jgi:hypothetical protein
MTPTRGAGSTTKHTKAGRTRARLNRDELQSWHAYFAAAISGIVAAHRRTPNPELVTRIASRIADRALDECRMRSPLC